MPPAQRTRTVEDVLWLLATNLVEMNRALLGDVLEAFESTDGKLDTQAESLRSMMSDINDQNQDRLDQLADTLTTQFAEVKAAIEDLRNQPGAEALDFSRADAAVQEVADTIPDAEPEPTPEP
jgi:hypothetical protein